MFQIQTSLKSFFIKLKDEISEDNVANGAAALAFYLMLAIFPAMILLLTLIPYLPIQQVDQAIMNFMQQSLPPEASGLFSGVVETITTERRGGLLSFGLIGTLWAASSGLVAVMQQLNITYSVKESRSFLKVRGTALLLLLLFAILIIGAFALIVFGGVLQSWLANTLGWQQGLLIAFATLRWVIIFGMILLGFALIYWLGPNVEQKFKFISPGSIVGTVLLAAASLAFNWYVSNFGDYNATYGSIGAVIILLLWLYITGLVLLVGAEVNSLLEHLSPEGKRKGQKAEPRQQTAPAT